MSEKQMENYVSKFPFLEKKVNTVLSSVFDEAFFLKAKLLREKYKNTEKKKWAILGSNSWIKGVDEAKKWCEDNNHEYEIL